MSVGYIEVSAFLSRSSTVNPLPLIQAMHFNRDDINLPGFHKFFLESAEEEMKHAQKVILTYFFHFLNSYRKVTKVTTPLKKRSFEGSDKISQVLANAKSSDPSKVATSKVISLLARNNGNYSYNKLN